MIIRKKLLFSTDPFSQVFAEIFAEAQAATPLKRSQLLAHRSQPLHQLALSVPLLFNLHAL